MFCENGEIIKEHLKNQIKITKKGWILKSFIYICSQNQKLDIIYEENSFIDCNDLSCPSAFRIFLFVNFLKSRRMSPTVCLPSAETTMCRWFVISTQA